MFCRISKTLHSLVLILSLLVNAHLYAAPSNGEQEINEELRKELVQMFFEAGAAVCMDDNGKWSDKEIKLPDDVFKSIESKAGQAISENEKYVNCPQILRMYIAAQNMNESKDSYDTEAYFACATTNWDPMDKLGLARDVDLALEKVFECKSESESSSDCIKDVACNVARSATFGLADMVQKYTDLSVCEASTETSCISEVLNGVLTNLMSTGEFIWDGVKAGASWVGGKISDWWNDSDEAENATSEKLHVLSSADKGFFDRLMDEPWKTMKDAVGNLISGIGTMVDEGIKDNFGCAKKEVNAQGEETCIEPVVSWGCASCGQKLNMACGVVGVLGGEVIMGLLTGGALTATKAAANAVKGVVKATTKGTRAAGVMSKVGNKLSIFGRGAASVISTGSGFAVKFGNKIVKITPNIIVKGVQKGAKVASSPFKAYGWAVEKMTELSLKGTAKILDGIPAMFKGRAGTALDRLSRGHATRMAKRASDALRNRANGERVVKVTQKAKRVSKVDDVSKPVVKTDKITDLKRNVKDSTKSNTNTELYLKDQKGRIEVKGLKFNKSGDEVIITRKDNLKAMKSLEEKGLVAKGSERVTFKVGEDIESAVVNFDRKTSTGKIVRDEKALVFKQDESTKAFVEKFSKSNNVKLDDISSIRREVKELDTFVKNATPAQRNGVYREIDKKLSSGEKLSDFETLVQMRRDNMITPKSSDKALENALDFIKTRNSAKVTSNGFVNGASPGTVAKQEKLIQLEKNSNIATHGAKLDNYISPVTPATQKRFDTLIANEKAMNKNTQIFLSDGKELAVKDLRLTANGKAMVIDAASNKGAFDELIKSGHKATGVNGDEILLRIGDDVEGAIVNYQYVAGKAKKVKRVEEAFQFAKPKSMQKAKLSSAHEFNRTPIDNAQILQSRLDSINKMPKSQRVALYSQIDEKIATGVKLSDYETAAMLYRYDVVKPKGLTAYGKAYPHSSDAVHSNAISFIKSRSKRHAIKLGMGNGASATAQTRRHALSLISKNGNSIYDSFVDTMVKTARVIEPAPIKLIRESVPVVKDAAIKLLGAIRTGQAVSKGKQEREIADNNATTTPINPQLQVKDPNPEPVEPEPVVTKPAPKKDDLFHITISYKADVPKVKVTFNAEKVDSCRVETKVIKEDEDGNEEESFVKIADLVSDKDKKLPRKKEDYVAYVKCSKKNSSDYKIASELASSDLKVTGTSRFVVSKCTDDECESDSDTVDSLFRRGLTPAPLQQFNPPPVQAPAAPVLNTL